MKLVAGDCDVLEDESLSRRMVLSCLRLRFEVWRDNLPRRVCDRRSGSLWSPLSEKLHRRFPAVVGWDERVVVALAALAVAGGPDRVEGAEITGEVEEAGEGGVDGWSAAIGEGESGEVSSARTKAGAGYPQMTRICVRGSLVPAGRRVSGGLCRDHGSGSGA